MKKQEVIMLQSERYTEFPHIAHPHMETFSKCYSICCSCAKKCIEDKKGETAILCSECADICALMIKWHSQNSEFTNQISELCADVCLKCGEACRRNGSPHCKQCSDICNECAKACQT